MVAIDSFTPMMELCGHLAQLGHRRVAYIVGSELSWQNRQRWRGIEMAAIARHIDPRLTTVVSPKAQLGDQAWALMRAALERDPSVLPPLLRAEMVVRDSTGRR